MYVSPTLSGCSGISAVTHWKFFSYLGLTSQHDCILVIYSKLWDTSGYYHSLSLSSLTAQNYQHLFYLLQTHPDYFAKLIFEMPQSKTNRFMENVILTVFNYAQNNREQFLLIKLFERALKEEIE